MSLIARVSALLLLTFASGGAAAHEMTMAEMERRVAHRGRRRAIFGGAREGVLARWPKPGLHAHRAPAHRAPLRVGRRQTWHGRDRARLPGARCRAHPERHRSPDVRGRAAVS